LAIRWAAYLRLKEKPGTWDCEFCKSKGLDKKRNCNGNLDGFCASHGTIRYEDAEKSNTGKLLCPKCQLALKMPMEIVLGKNYRLFQCPLNEIEPEALYLIKLVTWSESMGITPSGCSLFDETNWYYELRDFVVHEQALARSEMESPGPSIPKQGSQTPSNVRRR
jgi:hypothetical protein